MKWEDMSIREIKDIVTIDENGAFECIPMRDSEEYRCYNGKFVDNGVVIRETYAHVDFFDFYTPIFYDENLIIKNVDGMNITVSNTYTDDFNGPATIEGNRIQAKNKEIIDNVYENYKKLIADIKSGMDLEEIKSKYEINQIRYKDVSKSADEIIQKMEQGIDVEGTNEYVDQMNNNKQRGYSIIGILGLITCIATIGIILYGYILFYK